METEKPKSKVKEFLWNAAIVLLILAIFLVGYKILYKQPNEEVKLSVDIFGCKQSDINLTSNSIVSKYFDCVKSCTENIRDQIPRKECYQACSQVSNVCKGV